MCRRGVTAFHVDCPPENPRSTIWNCLYISVLWVKEGHQRKGYGHALMTRAEEIARIRPCDVIFLATMSFQAPGFYEKCGYARFAELNEAPTGFSRIWFAKRLLP